MPNDPKPDDRRERTVPPSTGSAPPHVVIIGAGFAGLATALGLGGTEIRVTIIDRHNYHLFVPLLYQVATASLSPADIAEPVRRIVNRHPNIEVLLAEVTGVDTARRQVLMGGMRVDYDHLVIATGSTHSYFGHDAWARHAPGLKTIEDARAIRARVLMGFEEAEMCPDPKERHRLMTVVVVGGGPTGVELAGAIAELVKRALARDFRHINPKSADILLVEAGPRLLPQFPEALSTYAQRVLERLGVTVLLRTPVESIDDRGVTAGGRTIPTEAVIWGAGVQASPAGRWLGVATDRAGRVKVNPDLSVPGLDRVSVLGDTALVLGEDGQPLPGLAQVAKQQGAYLAKALYRRLSRGDPPQPFRFKNRGNMATIGRNAAIADFGRLRLKGYPAWLLWCIVHIYLLVGFENRLLVSLQWLWAYVTFQRGARLITDEPPASAAPHSSRAAGS